MSTIWGFDHIENKYTLYHRKDCMKKFRESLREHAGNIISFEKKKMLLLTKEELKLHQDAKVCFVCGERNWKKPSKSVIYQKVRDHCPIQVNIEAQHLVFLIQKLMCPMKSL